MCYTVSVILVGDNDGEVPPVPIPNTEVKLIRVESTWRETAREDRSTPASCRRPLMWSFVFFLAVENATASCENASS